MRSVVTYTGKRRDARVLYITYDGLTDPLGRSQVLPYLAGLAERGHRITILSCEKPERMDKDGEQIRKLCANAGIGWHPLTYHKKPPILSSVLDALALQRAAIKLQRECRFEIVHCRSYIPGRAGLALKARFGARFLFDMRGFWPDEKVEGKNWNRRNPLYAAVYRYFKLLESRLLRGADHIVSLTEAGKEQLLTRPELASKDVPITIIPCCVDFAHFPLATSDARAAARQRLGIAEDALVLAYLGSLGGNYLLTEMLDFFRIYASGKSSARFLFVTQDNAEVIHQAAATCGVDSGQLTIRPASREEVPLMLAAADLGVAFKQPSFSAKACSPTKMGEMLAVGLPIVANAGVGDVDTIVEDTGCGVAIEEFTDKSYATTIDRLHKLEGTAKQRRDSALRWFDVEMGITRYAALYDELLRPHATQ